MRGSEPPGGRDEANHRQWQWVRHQSAVTWNRRFPWLPPWHSFCCNTLRRFLPPGCVLSLCRLAVFRDLWVFLIGDIEILWWTANAVRHRKK